MSIRPPAHRSISVCAGAWLVVALCGCAGPGGVASTRNDAFSNLDAGHNRILAWVPLERAASASTAQTVAYIALARAKRATESELCQGTWMFSGKLRQEETPQLTTAPARLGHFNGWQLRIAWEPQLAECGVSAQAYAQTLSRHLPAWMLAQSTQPVALFHQGEMIPSEPTALALHALP